MRRPCSRRPSAISMTASARTNWRWPRSWPRARWSSRSPTTPMSARGCCSTSCAPKCCRYVHGAPTSASQADMAVRYAEYFPAYVKTGIAAELLDPDSPASISTGSRAALKPERDLDFQFLGLQTLYDRYFLHAAATASNCRRPSSCGSPWGSRCARSIARRARSNSTICSRRSTSWPRPRPCSIPARCGRSSRPAS